MGHRAMNRTAYDYFSDMLRRESGLQISQEKYYLLETRLHPLVRQRGLENLGALAAYLRRDDACQALRQAVIEAMVTYDTSFFRDAAPFQALKETILPFLLRHKGENKKLHFWSAGCASGQEAYSLALLLRETGAALQGWDIDITGTDISHDIIQSARRGVYNQMEVQRGMPARILAENFTQDGADWRINDDIRAMVDFRHANLLLSAPFAAGGADIVFCRYALTNLDTSSRVKVLQNLHAAMHGGSVLFLGLNETVCGLGEMFKAVQGMQGVYVRAENVLGLPLA